MQRVGERALRLVPAGPLAGLAGLPNVPDAVVGQVQVVPENPSVAAAPPAPALPAAAPGTAPAELRLLAAVNRARAEHGAPLVARSGLLARPARRHSAALARLGYLTHQGPGRAPFWTRLVGAGFPAARPMGENLALLPGCDPGGAEQVVQLWLASPPHRANLLSRRFRLLGAGVSSDAACAASVYNADFGG